MKKALEKLKEFFKKNIIGMMIGAALVGGITLVNADYSFTATKVYYDKNTSLTTKTNVKAALDELYSRAVYGNATAAQILKNRTALVGGKEVTGTMPDNGNLSENLGWNATKTIPAGYTSGGTVKCKAWDANGNYCTKETATFSTETIYPRGADKTISVSTGKYITSGGTKTIRGFHCETLLNYESSPLTIAKSNKDGHGWITDIENKTTINDPVIYMAKYKYSNTHIKYGEVYVENYTSTTWSLGESFARATNSDLYDFNIFYKPAYNKFDIDNQNSGYACKLYIVRLCGFTR